MDYSVEVTEGPSEKGSDVVVTVQDELLLQEFRVGVQVKCFAESVSKDEVKRALDQLLSGWEENLLDSGVLLTTGTCTPDAITVIEEHNNRERGQKGPKKLVKLIEASQLAQMFLKHQGE